MRGSFLGPRLSKSSIERQQGRPAERFSRRMQQHGGRLHTRGVHSRACKAHSENATRNPMTACCCLACGAQCMCAQPMRWWQNLRKTFRMAPPPMLPMSLPACCQKDTAQVRRVTAHIHMRHSEHPPPIRRRACFMRAPVAAPRRRHVPSLLLPPAQPLLHLALRPRSSSELPCLS